jgi:hypothetical protein
MARTPSTDVQQQLQEAFEAFRDALQQLLEEQAQQSVADTLERLAKEGGPFRVQDAHIEVVIRDLTVASGQSAATAVAPRRTQAPPRARRSRRAGQRRGGVKEAMVAAIGADEEVGIADFEQRLKKAGVTTSTNNLHQQLRRLVQAGEIERSGRGRYRRVKAKS